MSDGFVAYWPFKGNANDVGENGNDGTVDGAALVDHRLGMKYAAYNFAAPLYFYFYNQFFLDKITMMP